MSEIGKLNTLWISWGFHDYAFYLDYIDDTEFLIARIWQCTVNISTTDIMVDICSLSKLHSYLSYKQECNFDIYL